MSKFIRVCTRFRRSSSAVWLLFVILGAGQLVTAQVTEPASPGESVVAPAAGNTATLQFSFDRAAWRDVLRWLADQSELALHFDQLPSGTFTYTDRQYYAPAEAIDRINMFLIPEGFAAVRSGGLLSVINLQDTKSLQKLDAMARYVTPEELETLAGHEVVKSMFDTEGLSMPLIAAEMRELNLIVEPVLLTSSHRILVTDTASKLQSVAKLLEASRSAKQVAEPAVRTYKLQHIGLADFLDVARPHLAIPPGQSASPTINISADASDTNVYASGTPAALALLEQLLKVIDQPDRETEPQGTQQLKSHTVRSESLATVYDVLQTVLADQPIRLSMDAASSSIIALGDPSVHDTISSTIAEVEGEGSEFAIVELKSLDPYFAITLLNEMFDLKRVGGAPAATTPASQNNAAIKIDADPKGRRLFIRGPMSRVAEIRKVITQLDSEGPTGRERVIPIFGARATGVLRAASRSWGGDNPIYDLPASGIRASITERVVASRGDTSADAPAQWDAVRSPASRQAEAGDGRGRGQNEPASEEPAVRSAGFISAVDTMSPPADSIEAQVTSRGIVLQSNDPNALQSFESHLRETAQSDGVSAVETVIYYLKYATANEGARMLADLLDGATSVVDETAQASLVNANVPPANSAKLIGSLLRSNQGSTVVTSGTLSVIADARLNRLICIGTQEDLSLVEQYLEVIDKDTSLTQVEIYGASHVIELEHTRAEEIAGVVRDAYGDRVSLTSKQKLDQQAAQQAARGPDAAAGGKQTLIQTSRNQEPQMSVAIHEASNSLVITAPDPLFREVEQLIRRLDAQAAQTVEVIYYPSVEGVEMLQNALGGGARPSGRSRSRR